MKVDLTTFGPEPPEKNQTGRTGQTGSGETTISNTPASSSGLNPARFAFDQTRVQSLASQVLAQPDVREAKVQSLQLAISNGHYSVPSALIAEALASNLGGAQG